MKFEFFGIAVAAATVAACSSQPTQPAASTPAPVAAPSPTPAAGAPAVAPAANGEAPVLSRSLVSAGYKATTIKGEIYYCRMEDVTNTAFKRKVCLTEAQLKDQERKTKEMQDRMIRQQTNPGCAGPSCG